MRMSNMRISKVVRDELETIFQYMMIDRPTASYDAQLKLAKLLGYAMTEDGEKVSIEEWNKP
jgi:hypothetical protein